MVASIVPVPPFDLVVIGATGDLARRKLIPSLFERFHAGQIPDGSRIIGTARKQLSQDAFRNYVAESLTEFAPNGNAESVASFLATLDYVATDATSEVGWEKLANRLGPADRRVRAFYLSVAPRFFAPVAEKIVNTGSGNQDCRIVVEKPLGHDLASARELNAQLARHFDESQVYRIDHYLGKETVQNLMALRFANALFEPLWNSHHIDHVQITVAETVGVAGRGGYYDQIGATRDMVQNHLLQLLCLIAMEPPSRFRSDTVRDEKLKVLRALAPLDNPGDIIRGQYRGVGTTASYGEDVGNPDSRTESFVALRAGIDNWRWAGVPFYLRTGKRLRSRVSEIAVVFHAAPHSIFSDSKADMHQNVLAIRLQPNEGITLGMTIKEPGPGGMRLIDTDLDMTFAERLDATGLVIPDAYERLVMDVIRGDQTLFMRGDEVEAAWAWIDPLIEDWKERGDAPKLYDPSSSGPEDALMLLHRDGRRWRELAA